MEVKEFNTEGFQYFLIRELSDLQRGELTESKRGAIKQLLRVDEEFNRLVKETLEDEQFGIEDGDVAEDENN